MVLASAVLIAAVAAPPTEQPLAPAALRHSLAGLQAWYETGRASVYRHDARHLWATLHRTSERFWHRVHGLEVGSRLPLDGEDLEALPMELSTLHLDVLAVAAPAGGQPLLASAPLLEVTSTALQGPLARLEVASLLVDIACALTGCDGAPFNPTAEWLGAVARLDDGLALHRLLASADALPLPWIDGLSALARPDNPLRRARLQALSDVDGPGPAEVSPVLALDALIARARALSQSFASTGQFHPVHVHAQRVVLDANTLAEMEALRVELDALVAAWATDPTGVGQAAVGDWRRLYNVDGEALRPVLEAVADLIRHGVVPALYWQRTDLLAALRRDPELARAAASLVAADIEQSFLQGEVAPARALSVLLGRLLAYLRP
ncbi:MAG TPA: hypothetical protein VFH51_15040 [Myxococcota bacterium]|nr:hypothetical protein [Myxococcota bacterium]